ncbi:glycoside hydrolase family 16 protein [Scleroderma yunnanense]
MVGSSETDSSSSPPASSSNDPSPSPPTPSVSGTDTPSAEVISSPTPSDPVDHEPLQTATTTTSTHTTTSNRRIDSPPSESSSSAHVRSPSRTMSSVGFISSPLNPNAPNPQLRSSPLSRPSNMPIPRVASEESQALASHYLNAPPGYRGSMILYRLSVATSTSTDQKDTLQPPQNVLGNGGSRLSASGDSIFSLSSDSKYPFGAFKHGALVPYAIDPELEIINEPEEDDFLHDPEDPRLRSPSRMNLRALLNVGSLFLLILGLMFLFVFYPVYNILANHDISAAMVGNALVNSTGQVPVPGTQFTLPVPLPIDPDTPTSAQTRTGFDGYTYDLVFSDEFNKPGRTFGPSDDPYWEAANLWYEATNDLEYYDPAQVTTKQGGYLSIVMDSEPEDGLNWRSGMLQSWNKFCFTTGYIEVAISLPGSVQAQGYWPGAWTMGNLARPGYPATTDGVWPYSYDSCDVGTFPNQTYANGSGPAAALQSDASIPAYNNALSWLPGQRLSSCTCPGEDHPGPSTSVGRGAPEIDILEVQYGNLFGDGQVVSQSAQVAPFTHDYLYQNDTQDEWHVYAPNITTPNSYHQQTISALTELPTDILQDSGSQFTTFGFEYWSNPKNASDGYIIWQTGGQPTARIGAGALGPDLGVGGTQVGQRLISVEPMSIVLNLGMSPSWQSVNMSTLTFPVEMRVDYVRVYQRRGETNIGCNPNNYPTADYINRHMDTYNNPNLTAWNQSKPRNSLYAGGC